MSEGFSYLVRLFSWLIQAAIIFTAPGLIFLSLFKVDPQFAKIWGELSLTLVLVYATALGLIMTAIGTLLMLIVRNWLQLDSRLYGEFVRNQAQIEAGTIDMRALMRDAPPATQQQLGNITPHQVVGAWADEIVRRRLNQGVARSIVMTLTNTVPHEVRGSIISSETQLQFAHALLGIAVTSFSSQLVMACMSGNILPVVQAAAAALLLCGVSIAVYVAHKTMQLGMFLGMGSITGTTPPQGAP